MLKEGAPYDKNDKKTNSIPAYSCHSDCGMFNGYIDRRYASKSRDTNHSGAMGRWRIDNTVFRTKHLLIVKS